MTHRIASNAFTVLTKVPAHCGALAPADGCGVYQPRSSGSLVRVMKLHFTAGRDIETSNQCLHLEESDAT
ncbi:MAG: hypothetical protein AAGD07_23505 [Planctomycetota bacterium]